MVSIYQDADYLSAFKQKQKLFRIFMGTSLFYFAFCIGWLIYFIGLPYNATTAWLPKLMVYASTVLYVVLIFPFMAIKYSRSNRYYKMMFHLSEGMKAEECNYFYCFREKSLQKENIDVVSCVFETWNKKKQEWMEREAYCDPMPDFGMGDLVKYVCQSNFIVQYEILERHAYDFKEEYEEDEYFEQEEETEPSISQANEE